MQAPDGQTDVRDPDDRPHALRHRITLLMTEEAANKERYLVFSDRQIYQTIPSVAETGRIKIEIAGKEGWATYVMQERENFLVLHPLTAHVIAQVTHRNAPTP